MGDISRNLSRKEFACPCGKCNKDTVDFQLAEVLQDVVNHFVTEYGEMLQISIRINSGHRCAEHNKAVGGSASSLHLDGRAADFIVKNVHPDEVADYLEAKYPNTFGIGRYRGRTHVDTRSGMARWDKRGEK